MLRTGLIVIPGGGRNPSAGHMTGAARGRRGANLRVAIVRRRIEADR